MNAMSHYDLLFRTSKISNGTARHNMKNNLIKNNLTQVVSFDKKEVEAIFNLERLI